MGHSLEAINIKYFELAIPASNRGRQQSKDYIASCPFCGDGHKKNSKRFHLFTKSNYDYDMLKCFNGDCAWEQPSNMYKFLKELNPALYQAYIQELNGEKISALSVINNENKKKVQEQKDSLVIESLDIRTDEDTPDKLFNIPVIFKKIEEDSYGYNYLISRGVDKDKINDFLEVDSNNSIYKYKDNEGNVHEKDLKDYLIIPLYWNESKTKLYGFTSRNTKDKEFYTRIPEENSGFKVWNWYNIDRKKKVYIFEAVFDSLSIEDDNVIACLGADLPMDKIKLINNHLDNAVFIFDNDKTGEIKAMKYASLGYNVMVWGDIKFKDTNSILTSGGTKEKIQKFIDKNIYKGLSATIRLKV